MSATAHGGLDAAFQASMSSERSMPIPAAARAALAAPVPAPASSTLRPARRWGLIATSSAAMGPYTSDAPSAQRRLAPA